MSRQQLALFDAALTRTAMLDAVKNSIRAYSFATR